MDFFSELPPQRKRGAPSKYFTDEVKDTLAETPGAWGLIAENVSKTVSETVNRVDGYEAATRPGETLGRYDIYARYTGEPPR